MSDNLTPDDAIEVARLRTQLAEAERTIQAFTAVLERMPEAHVRWSVLGSDEPPRCADWCHVCRVEKTEAANERVRRMAQVWVDMRPTRPTVTQEGHLMADVGQQILDALDAPHTAVFPDAPMVLPESVAKKWDRDDDR